MKEAKDICNSKNTAILSAYETIQKVLNLEEGSPSPLGFIAGLQEVADILLVERNKIHANCDKIFWRIQLLDENGVWQTTTKSVEAIRKMNSDA